MYAVVASIVIPLCLLSTVLGAESPDTAQAAGNSVADTAFTRYDAVDRFPYARGSIEIGWPEDYEPRQGRFVICQALIDAQGRVIEVGALGCDQGKEPLCDQVMASIAKVKFIPARREGRPVPVTVVFPVTFPADRDSSVRVGAPVVDRWDADRCAYRNRIMGSGELALSERPVPTRRVSPLYPAGARDGHIPGDVELKVVVDTAGVPCFVLCEAVVPPGAGFVESAVRAAYQWRFGPGRSRGEPQSVWVELPFTWRPDE